MKIMLVSYHVYLPLEVTWFVEVLQPASYTGVNHLCAHHSLICTPLNQ